MPVREKALLIDRDHQIPVARQATLLGIARSTVYYQQVVSKENLSLMRLIDEIYTRCPFFGSRRIREMLRRQGYVVNRKRVISLMQQMGIACVYPGPHTSRPHPGHVIYPHLLRHRTITYANEVWASDITSIRMRRGWLYLVAIMDSCSRYVLSWEVAITLEVDFCIRALEGALLGATPHIFNTDQGAQFTSIAFVDVLKETASR